VQSKSDQIRRALAAGDPLAALRIASHFHDRSRNTMIFKRGFDAHNNPGVYRQIGKDPEQLTAIALALLEMNFAPLVASREQRTGRRVPRRCP
jgi:hypothetical protein